MGVYKLSANSVKNGRTNYGSMLAGNAAFIPPSFESIATVSVGSGGSSTISFTSIPGTYAHLQIRYLSRSAITAYGGDTMIMEINSATADRDHLLLGNGSSAASEAHTAGYIGTSTGSATGFNNMFGAGIIDILDYANTNKNRVARSLTGHDNNGEGELFYFSWLKASTTAISSITLKNASTNNFAQYSHFALYGIKSA